MTISAALFRILMKRRGERTIGIISRSLRKKGWELRAVESPNEVAGCDGLDEETKRTLSREIVNSARVLFSINTVERSSEESWRYP